jgi:hypothetical protein
MSSKSLHHTTSGMSIQTRNMEIAGNKDVLHTVLMGQQGEQFFENANTYR